MNLSHSASSVSLRNAFAEMHHQAQMAEGPSTAPPIFNQTGPPFPTSLTNLAGSFSGAISGLPPSSTVTLSSLPTTVPASTAVSTQPLTAGVSTQPLTTGVTSGVSTQPLTTGVIPGVSVSTSTSMPLTSLSTVPVVVGVPVAPGSMTSPPVLPLPPVSGGVAIPQALTSPPLQPLVGSVPGTLPHTSVSAPVLMSTVTPAQVQLSSSTSAPSFVEGVPVSATYPEGMKQPSEVSAAISTTGMSLPISTPLTYAGVAAAGLAMPGSTPLIHSTHHPAASTPVLSQAGGAASTPVTSQVPLPGAVPASQQVPGMPNAQHTISSTGPGLPHAHSVEGEGDSLTKSGIDDIKTLEEKLRSLFSEHGSVGAPPSTPQEAPAGQEGGPLPGPPPTTISSQTKPATAPPTSLPLGQSGMPILSQGMTPGQASTPVTYVSATVATAAVGKAATPPAKTPLSRVPVNNAIHLYYDKLKTSRV